ncbi:MULTISPECIES: carboxy terminal-processing peptidase [unclassified Shewanella]|uniref:carboxy terminal-processing peptidase n=1 Tax=unclassified Shewanella TaxID=196818 RepID=UPI001B747E76|nr:MULTISPECIES: carboxy terminal-processing peptidase [unclassified Shewanella]MBP6519250.1 carboxy terminal-processing peptidase [Shewanella sp.]MCU8003892.1 carboxy terminal-processing peptidase [Shewanella sp. SM96]MCU8060568.1 carboxy terminal-processing peptidase [Shewanella sp. SM55]MCU8068713.1 carboxy terminal-processing peptidase [Shewanella sp. SM32]MCU8087558.1 carboxy terminal-processing peptidase [Shewanella sp. SM21]
MRKLTLATSIATVFVGFSAWAVPPTIQISELPTLKQEAQHKVASKRVTDLYTRSHYHRFNLDDAFSAQIFDRYLQQLDYRRNVLTQADVDSFKPYATQFDDMLSSGELEPAYKMFDIVQKRRYEGFVYALSLLDKEMDFSAPGDAYEYDRDEAAWPKDQAEINELWRQRVKYDALNLKLTGKKWPEIVDILQKRYNNAIKRLIQTNSEDVFQGVMNAFSRSIEPHTSYLSPRNAERFQMEMNLSLEGIGAQLQLEDDYTVIKSLITGGPAAGSEKLSPEDKIVGVGQEGGEIVDVIGWRLDDVVDLIKGPKGSKVVLQILPKKGGSNAKPFDVTLVRDKIRLEDRAATSKVIEPKDGEYANRKVGVIQIPGFYMNLSQDVEKELVKLNDAKVEGIVIDLRGNGGGALTEAVLLTGLFIDMGPVVQIRDADGRVSAHRDNDGKTSYVGPLTVMVDRYSASASEIFAAALQDYDRALIVGESSFGKGTVQQHKSLGRIYDMYEKPIGHVQYTIQKFYRINGGSTQIKGVTPNIAYPSALEPGEYGEAEEKNALPWDKVPMAQYGTLNDVTPELVTSLESKHLNRIKNSVEFAYINQDIADFKKHHKEKTVSLVESERIASREADEKKVLDRTNERRVANGLAPVKSMEDIKDDAELPDAFLDETAYITLDMADVQKVAKTSAK